MEFESPNKIKMVEGKLFNWEKAPIYFDSPDPWARRITLGGLADCWSCIWDDDRLSITNMAYSSNTSISFVCDVDMAEEIVVAFAKANLFDIMPLHKK